MKALLFEGRLRYTAEAPRPEPAPGEALVRVVVAGICSTDLEILKGYMNFRGIPGHEFVGVVASCEETDWIGKRVVGEINCPCGGCPTCRAGRPRHCPHRTVLGIQGRNGAFAEYLTLPVSNLHPVPDEVPDQDAVFVEPLAAAFEILEQTEILPGEGVVVVGDGRLGLLTVQVLRAAGADPVLVGHHAANLARARDMGISVRQEKDAGDLAGTDLVVDCSGSLSGFERSRRLVRPGGRLVLKSTFASDRGVDLSPLVVDEITLIGSRCGPFAPALSALAAEKVRVSSLVSAVYPLEQGEEALTQASRPGVLKVLLRTP